MDINSPSNNAIKDVTPTGFSTTDPNEFFKPTLVPSTSPTSSVTIDLQSPTPVGKILLVVKTTASTPKTGEVVVRDAVVQTNKVTKVSVTI